MIGYVGNLEELTVKNNDFRHVIFTGGHAQLVLMSVQVGEELGSEVHAKVDQFFRVEVGTLKIIMNGEENVLSAGMAAIVPAGTIHNVINTGTEIAKLYTVYSPPNHPAETVHHTKADAEVAEMAEHAQ